MRVVPNLYPALERQEVVIHTPRHVESFADLTPREIELVAAAWHERAQEASAAGFGYVHALVNEGREAGASLAHSHSQLVWLREPPPEVVAEKQTLREGACMLCELLDRERSEGSRVVSERGELVTLAAYAGRLPYELLIAGEHSGGHDGFRAGVLLVRALELLADGVRRLHAVEGRVPLNAWLHNSGHWHIELLPRLTVFAGLELGAGIYVNPLAPEDAAQALREVEP